MARKKKDEVALNDESSYAEDDLRYAADDERYSGKSKREQKKVKREQKKVKREQKRAERNERKDGRELKGSKTLTERYRYKGKYFLLPERELRKQLKFYQKVFNYRYLGIISGVIALIFSMLAVMLNAYFAVLTLLIVITGTIYSIVGMVKLRGFSWILGIIAIALNIAAIAVAMKPMTFVFTNLNEIIEMFNEYLEATGA